jgi:DNA polymerase-3 subunit epsilon/DNA polymerase-3 subunit alpha (Gram-positive type)
MYQNLRTNDLTDNYVVFDIETSGLNPSKDKIIEIGAIKYINNKKVDEFSYLIDPEIKLTKIITDVTGLTDSDLIGKEKIDYVLPKFLDFIEDFTIIGHNVKFDYNFIEANIKKLHLNPIKNKIIDTLFLSRITIYDSKNHKLKTLKEYLGLKYNSHRALDDCLTCNDLYQYCKNKKQKK